MTPPSPHHEYSPLRLWLQGRSALPPPATIETLRPHLEIGGFLGLEQRLPLHEADQVEPQSLADSWKKTHAYVTSAMALINTSSPGWLGADESEDIRSALGPPPVACYPIYIMSVRAGGVERAVYVGKTSSQSSRFGGGHDAFRMLLAPQYDGAEKFLYLGVVILLTRREGRGTFGFDGYLPLEWISPYSLASDLLLSVEASLIYALQPELNVHHRTRLQAKYEVTINIENHVEDSNFLHGEQT